ncbi:M23 family metallopeptidase [Aureimonas mangrovi]|uniref:M23 family metallopeptidase n=1 Tax=Aureimonas mangrovi TaxID=2758041 RepID=UPI00163DDD6A|nr:M23 family metallopeptidase [Aureimonas mangrovi]
MSERVMVSLKRGWVRSVAIVGVAAAVAGCSNDVARLNDGFYTGAMPQQAPAQQSVASNTYGMGGVDTTNTGSIQSQYPASAGQGTGYGASSGVERSQLPPPPGAAYQSAPQPGAMQATNFPSEPAQQQQASSTVPQTRPAAAPTQSATAQPGGTVTVAAGDSLGAIARRTGVSVADLRSANNITGDNIRIGQTLTLPGGASQNTRVAALGAPETTLQAQAATQASQPSAATPAAQPALQQPAPQQPAQAAATTPAAPAATQPAPAAPAAPATTVAAETEREVASLAPQSTGISQFRWPVQGRVVNGFGDRVGSRRNDGVNISVPRGTPVKAAENGVVIYAGEGLKEFGKTVLVKHDNGLVTVYGHADEILVERGATVTRGQDIAKAGMTGETETPMLHFEVRKDSTPVDPMTYL